MKAILKSLMMCCVLAPGLIYFAGCDDDPGPQFTGDTKTYELGSVSDPGISGSATFAERDDGQILITIQLTGTQPGASHPAHIHANSAAETGGIVLDLSDVDGASGKSESLVKALNDGTPLSFDNLLAFNGYINVHVSAAALGTLVAQGDIGQNELTGDTKQYALGPVSNPAISGTATFAKRVNGETLVTVSLAGTTAGNSHPSHIHANSAAQGGGIMIDLNDIDGATGKSKTNVSQLNDATPITYDQLLNYNGYLNVHLSSASLGTLVAQGDIGQNELTGDKEEYTLGPVSDPAISGSAIFEKRKNGTTLVTVELTGTNAGDSHPSHIHANSAAQGGGIVIDLTNINGTTGISRTSVTQLNSATAITYDELIDFDGYLNVHLSSAALGTLVAQGDIGQNKLTGENKVYVLNAVSDPAISGTATFAERKNGNTMITISLQGTTAGGDHPAHIHANNATTGGGIVLDLKNVSGATGKSVTSAKALNDATLITYDELLVYNGYINVHLSSATLGTLVAQGNIGSNAP
ncbi:MAG: CHRD domain-containing protein [Cyclobacteriaceae bacterium]|nr:CHRD domain-containing protein [Cyclobacteriaceae bacterium]